MSGLSRGQPSPAHPGESDGPRAITTQKRTAATVLVALTAVTGALALLHHRPAAFGPAIPEIAPAVVTTQGCTSVATAGFAQTQGEALAPMCSSDTWVFDLPETAAPAGTRRTEAHWGSTTAAKAYHEGDTITYEADYRGFLGAAAQDDSDWQVIWQLHGPVRGEWPGPAMGLFVRNGTLRIGGGDGHEGQDWTQRNYEWSRVLAPWVDGSTFRVKVTTYLSSDPDKGWVSASCNDHQILDHWRPVSAMDLRPGTMYAGTEFLASRTGLYRGTQGGSPPTYRQVIYAHVLQAG